MNMTLLFEINTRCIKTDNVLIQRHIQDNNFRQHGLGMSFYHKKCICTVQRIKGHWMANVQFLSHDDIDTSKLHVHGGFTSCTFQNL